MNEFICTVIIYPDIYVNQLGLQIALYELPSLLIQHEGEERPKISETLVKALPMFKNDQKMCSGTFRGSVIPGPTTSSLQIKNNGDKTQNHDDL